VSLRSRGWLFPDTEYKDLGTREIYPLDRESILRRGFEKRSQPQGDLRSKNTNHGFPRRVSPTIRPSAPVMLRFSERSEKDRTFPLLIMGTWMDGESFSRLTCERSAAPCLRRRADTFLAWRVTQEEPCACKRSTKSRVFSTG